MSSRLARTSLGALVALFVFSTAPGTSLAAEPKVIDKCSGAIIKAAAAFVQAETKILQKCEETKLKGKVCVQSKVDDNLRKAKDKLDSSIAKACGGKDKTCATPDADQTQPTLTEIGWPTACPGFEGKGCTSAISDCSGIASCIQCVSNEAVRQAIGVYYPTGRPSSTGNKTQNKCQVAVGKGGATFLIAKSKALAKCWGTKAKNKPANCPADAQSAIANATQKLLKTIGKPCATLMNGSDGVGLTSPCMNVVSSAASCSIAGDPVVNLADVQNCISCVTEFKVDCADRLGATSEDADYPTECGGGPTPTASPTPSPTPTQKPTCGNGVLDSDEQCDPTSAKTTCTNVDNMAFPCNAITCTCNCPKTVTFSGNAEDPASILDTGWTGIAHRAPIISNGDVTVQLQCSTAGRPCGVCTVSGPVPNTQPNTLQNQRCSNDSSIKCTSDAQCGSGKCVFYFGSNLPLAAGGVTACVANVFNGPVSGTANVESGEAATSANLTSTVYTGIKIDSPCVLCNNDPTINDGVQGGTCSDGTRKGLACDANGSVPGRPDFGKTSLDCPLSDDVKIATLPIDLTNATDPVTVALTAESPVCQGELSAKCLCDTCNSLAEEPCQVNADCNDPAGPIGPICGGRRCISGTNDGAACDAGSVCPGGICGRPGEPARPAACLDNTATPGLECTDTAPVDGEGECTEGPLGQNCSVASGHAQRGCTMDSDCGGGVGSCQAANRPCFLTGGFSARVGSNTLIATGMEDPPMNDTSSPTLGAVFCVGPTGSTSINQVSGLPGPGRVTIKGNAKGLP